MIETVIGYDAMAENEHVLPEDMMVAGYDTQVGGGTGYIAWTAQQYARHAKPYPALHIDQNPAAGDFTFDYIDVEAGAFTVAEIPGIIVEARASFASARRPGQHWPGVYCSLSGLNDCVTECHNANLVNVPFIVADYGTPEAVAVNRVATATGPYPAVGYQFNNTAFGGLADTNVWSLPWIKNVSGKDTAMALTASDVDLIWARKFDEYIDENGNGKLDPRTCSDILFSAHRNTVLNERAIAALNASVAALAAKISAPVDVQALASELTPVIQSAIASAGSVDVQAIASAVAATFASKLGA